MSLPDTEPKWAHLAHFNQPAVIAGTASWSWAELHATAIQLVDGLDDGTALCNLCTTRRGFMVTWLAALHGHRMQILPPSSGRSELNALLEAAGAVTLVTDDAALVAETWPGNTRCLLLDPDAASSAAAPDDFVWTPDCRIDHVTLHTSGSTGAPVPHAKNLRHLMRGAASLRALLDTVMPPDRDARLTLVSSVPSQHMFGFESSVMLPLMSDALLWEGQPLLPADVADAFAEIAAPGIWLTTPVHISALVRTGESIDNCGGILSSTMQLSPALAARAEALANAPVIEVYGSTETGLLASRRPSRSTAWQPAAGVQIEATPTGIEVRGTHFRSPQTLLDRIESHPDGFELLGRGEDLVKVAGRRASLAGLNQLLADHPGIDDASFLHPRTGDHSGRMVLFYVGTSVSRNDLLTWLRGRIDPAFLPRAVYRVAEIPRSPNGKLRYSELARLYQALTDGTTP